MAAQATAISQIKMTALVLEKPRRTRRWEMWLVSPIQKGWPILVRRMTTEVMSKRGTARMIKGLRTAEIQQRLGPQEYEEVIHRDNLVIL